MMFLAFSPDGLNKLLNLSAVVSSEENDPVVFATAAATIIPLGNAKGVGGVCFHLNIKVLICEHLSLA